MIKITLLTVVAVSFLCTTFAIPNPGEHRYTSKYVTHIHRYRYVVTPSEPDGKLGTAQVAAILCDGAVANVGGKIVDAAHLSANAITGAAYNTFKHAIELVAGPGDNIFQRADKGAENTLFTAFNQAEGTLKTAICKALKVIKDGLNLDAKSLVKDTATGAGSVAKKAAKGVGNILHKFSSGVNNLGK